MQKHSDGKNLKPPNSAYTTAIMAEQESSNIHWFLRGRRTKSREKE